MRRTCIAILAACLFALPFLAQGAAGEHGTLASSVTSNADAAWEGLSSGEQAALRGTGETGQWLDELVVEYRTAVANTPPGYVTKLERDADGLWRTYAVQTCEEDEPCWNCHTMGNHLCGSDLPRTD